MKKNKIIYVPLAVDILHSGHLNILRKAKKYGDIVIGYSGSGNSPNVINALKYAKSKGNYAIGITGNYKNGGGGKLATIANLTLVFDALSMEVIEDLYLVVNHVIKENIKLLLKKNMKRLIGIRL